MKKIEVSELTDNVFTTIGKECVRPHSDALS